MTRQAFICDAIRTPFGRYGGALSSVRTDDLGAVPLRALMERNKNVDWQAVGDVLYGCANQAGEDNRNVARMSALLAGLPVEVGGGTINRLCGSGLDAVGTAARAIKARIGPDDRRRRPASRRAAMRCARCALASASLIDVPRSPTQGPRGGRPVRRHTRTPRDAARRSRRAWRAACGWRSESVEAHAGALDHL